MENGVEIICSPEEETVIRQHWALNDKYPEYCGHLMFDGVNPPEHNIEECKKDFLVFLANAATKCLSDIKSKIEIAEENGDGSARDSLISYRKVIKSLLNPDISSVKTIDDLRSAVPEQLKPYFPS